MGRFDDAQGKGQGDERQAHRTPNDKGPDPPGGDKKAIDADQQP
jgi:hypothetical protein